MKNWNLQEVEILTSKGGVIALANPYDNLVATGVKPWPHPRSFKNYIKADK
jgi:hypothetical protein